MTMNANISDPAMFYVTLRDVEGNILEDALNPLAEGLTIVHQQGEDDAWGYVSWYDKIAADMRSIEIKKPPQTVGSDYKLIDLLDYKIDFKYITKEVFEKNIKPLLNLKIPELKSDNEVQKYLSGLNPFDNNF